MRQRILGTCTGLIVLAQAAVLIGPGASRAFGQLFPCPIADPLCQGLPNDCVTTVVGTDCHPKKVVADPLIPGGIRAVECSCYAGSDCGGIVVNGTIVSCSGFCPVPPIGNQCNVIINGTPSNLPSVDASLYPAGTTFECGCNPASQTCEPLPDGSACRQVQCPGPGQECQPKCYLRDNQGVFTVASCECKGLNDCHAVLPPAPSLPICDGGCPPGQICIQRIIPVANGTLYCCECVEDPPFCEPTTDGQACKPFNCPPDPTGLPQSCKPRCVRMDAHGGFTVLDCECRGANECHAVFEPGLTPYCQGDCPPGWTCVQNLYDNQNGTFDLCCDCIPPICRCPGDIDGNGILNGLDIAGFVRCLIGTPLPTDNCACADIDGDGDKDFIDLNLFVIHILGKTNCEPCCPREDLVLNLGTGVDDQGNLIPVGNGDDNWVVTAESTSYGALGRPATVVTPHGSWFTIPGTQWISNNYFAQNGTYEYQFCFCLDDRYSNPGLTLQIRADDSAPGAETTVYLNNNFLGNAASFGAALPANLSTNNPNYFQKGQNCVKVIVINSGGAPTGFNMAGTVTAKDGKCCCPPQNLSKDVKSGVYDNNGPFIPVGQDDDTWTVTCDATGGTVPRPAKVIQPHGAWDTIPGTQWISATTGPLNGVYCYEYCFCLDPRFKNAALVLDVLADDSATIWLNKVQIGATPAGWAFKNPPTHIFVTNQALFKPCENCIEIKVTNSGGVITGLDVAGTITAVDGLCCDDRQFSCCLPSGLCVDLAPGVTQCDPQSDPPGQLMNGPCGPSQACCMPNGSCQMLSPRCCVLAGGTVLPSGTVCSAPQACCIPGGGGPCGVCINVDPACCTTIYGGVPQGPGSSCQP